jgi:hypothetical protein
VQLRGGTYPQSSTHTFDNSGGGTVLGTATNWITWQKYASETPILTKRFRLQNVSYYRFEDLTFHSYGDPWVTGGEAVVAPHHIYFLDCIFTEIEAGNSYSGIYLVGTNFITIDGCRVDDWFNGDAIRFDYGSRILIKNCDFPEAKGGHSVLSFKNITRSIVHRNWFRNPIDRAISIVERLAGDSENIIIQWNVFIDNDWNQTDAHPLDGTAQEDDRGATAAIRFAVRRGLFRYNVVALTNIGKDYSWCAQIDISFYNGSHDANFMRFYHNVIHAGKRSGFNLDYNTSIGQNFEDLDIRFVNNCITQNDNYGLHIADSRLSWRTYRVLNNVIADTRKSSTLFISGESPTAISVSTAESKYSQVFKNNVSTYPTYENPSLLTTIEASPTSYGVADIDSVFQAMQLQSGSAGESAGAAMATVTAAGTTVTDINVTDAIPFSNGWGLVDKDEIYVGGNLVEVVEVLSDTRIRVTPAINVSVGDPVYHAIVESSTPNIGLPTEPFTTTDGQVPVDPPPPPATDETTPEDDETDIIAAPPTTTPITDAPVQDSDFPNANPILQKPGLRLSLGGVSDKSPLMKGLAATIYLALSDNERLLSWRIYNEDGFENQLLVNDQFAPEADLVFGTDTDSSADGSRNVIEWITNYGVTKRQMWVKDPPTVGGIYVGNQEAQSQGATFTIGAGEPLTFGINILPDFADEFFAGHNYTGNRYANTIRSWAGALTSEVFLDGVRIVSETYLGDIHGYFWPSPGSGAHTIKARLRAAQASGYYVDIDGTITIQYG